MQCVALSAIASSSHALYRCNIDPEAISNGDKAQTIFFFIHNKGAGTSPGDACVVLSLHAPHLALRAILVTLLIIVQAQPPPREAAVPVDGVKLLQLAPGVKVLRGLCSAKLRCEVEYNGTSGSSDNTYLIQVEVRPVGVQWCFSVFVSVSPAEPGPAVAETGPATQYEPPQGPTDASVRKVLEMLQRLHTKLLNFDSYWCVSVYFSVSTGLPGLAPG